MREILLESFQSIAQEHGAEDCLSRSWCERSREDSRQAMNQLVMVVD
jgi:hypothetical protein